MGEAEQKVLKNSIPEENTKTMIRDKRGESKLFQKIEMQVCFMKKIHYFALHFD